nr:MAG TPA: hypothetical protein [Caudoviricetes sp.]
MEWLIASIVFAILAKQGLKRQGKEVRVKEAASTIAANVVLEAADLFEIEVTDIKQGKRP